MKVVFADTFFYLALLSEDDAAHQRATAFSKSYRGRTLTTAWVLTEVADALAAPRQRLLAVELIRQLQSDPTLTVVAPEEGLFERGLELYESREDKHWSLTDCITFITMEENGISEALTGDHHFEQAGFIALLK